MNTKSKPVTPAGRMSARPIGPDTWVSLWTQDCQCRVMLTVIDCEALARPLRRLEYNVFVSMSPDTDALIESVGQVVSDKIARPMRARVAGFHA